ncbi:retrotransposon protein, putative, ty1-copia subclass [Tanacetum coccineum]
MVFNSPCLTDKKELIHYEGTTLVPLRYVVPTGKDNFIVSAGRPNMVPASITIAVKIYLEWDLTESDKWIDAMNTEMQSMIDNMVGVLVDLPPNCKTVGSKWPFKIKTDMDGNVHTYKARLVAKGYTQLYGVDYEETFSPVADIRAIRILISIAAFYDYEIWQMDVKTAFLNGHLDEDIYMVQPEGFVDPKHPRKVCKLQRSIYGLKQASRSWNKRFDEEIKRSKRLIGLSQSAYMDKILKRYRMDNSKRGHIPMQEILDLNKTQGASTPEEVKQTQKLNFKLIAIAMLDLRPIEMIQNLRHDMSSF